MRIIVFFLISIVSFPWGTLSAKTLLIEVRGMQIWSNVEVWTWDRRIDLIQDIVHSIFFPFSYTWLSVLLDKEQYEPRAKIRGKNIIVSSHILQNGEFLKLFIHELAHFIDLYFLRATDLHTDPSHEFYRISWQSPYVKHNDAGIASFVSGYAASNQYEDFAETMVWYIFHNDDFIDRAMKNDALRAKYMFFATHVFPHGEFQGTDFSVEVPPEYLWDTTKIPILLQKYLFFLRNSL